MCTRLFRLQYVIISILCFVFVRPSTDSCKVQYRLVLRCPRARLIGGPGGGSEERGDSPPPKKSAFMHWDALHCFALQCFALALLCIALLCIALHYFELFCFALLCFAWLAFASHCIAIAFKNGFIIALKQKEKKLLIGVAPASLCHSG